MYTYEEDSNYIDEEKRSRIPFFVLLVILIVVVLVMVLSCGMKEKDKNSNLGYLKLTDAIIEPVFSKNKYNYSVSTTSDIIKISCGPESSKSKVEGCNKSLTISKNVKHIIKITAEDGSFKKYVLNISKEITKKEQITVSIEANVKSNEKTSEEVTLRAKLSSDKIPVKYEWYKDGKIIPNAVNANYIAEESGMYYVKIVNDEMSALSGEFIVNLEKKENTKEKTETHKDNANSNKFVLKINSIKGNSSTWVKSVTLKVDVTASNGLADKAYSFDGGKTYQKSNSKTFTNNQKIKIVVKDKAGKTVTDDVIISKVDSSIPKVSISYTDKISKSVSLYATVNPTNIPSGYKYKWYKDGKVIQNANSLTYKATSAGTYKFEVTTGSGNIVSATYKFAPVVITCPTLLVTDSTGKAVKHNTWINDYVFVKISPSKETVSYDVYLNESGHFDSVNKNFTYYNTFDTAVKVKIVNGGVRTLKIVIKDKNGNQNICYSKNYYLK